MKTFWKFAAALFVTTAATVRAADAQAETYTLQVPVVFDQVREVLDTSVRCSLYSSEDASGEPIGSGVGQVPIVRVTSDPSNDGVAVEIVTTGRANSFKCFLGRELRRGAGFQFNGTAIPHGPGSILIRTGRFVRDGADIVTSTETIRVQP